MTRAGWFTLGVIVGAGVAGYAVAVYAEAECKRQIAAGVQSVVGKLGLPSSVQTLAGQLVMDAIR